MIKEVKKDFEFPLIEVVKYDIKNIITTNPQSWEEYDFEMDDVDF